MSTATMMMIQLAELRMILDRDNPLHVRAEAEFAAMVANVVRGAQAGATVEDQAAVPVTMMLGTAEAYDALSGSHCRNTPEAFPRLMPRG